MNKLEELLRECEEIFVHCVPVYPTNLAHVDAVRALGDKIGYGHMMELASSLWRENMAKNNWPVGGEFVSGPCRATAEYMIREIREALAEQENKPKNMPVTGAQFDQLVADGVDMGVYFTKFTPVSGNTEEILLECERLAAEPESDFT